MMAIRPRLTPAVADVRRAVRAALQAQSIEPAAHESLAESSAESLFEAHPESQSESRSEPLPEPLPESPSEFSSESPAEFRPKAADATGNTRPDDAPLVLVALSGGPDSLALAAATAFEASRLGVRAGAVIVDHRLQPQSAEVAAHAREQALALGLHPVIVLAVDVDSSSSGTVTGGLEAAARTARYAALGQALADTNAGHVLLGHTLDDQAETVLLGLARGSGPRSLQGMAPASGPWLRPLLGIRRSQTVQFCADAGLTPWNDPHNLEPRFARVRVRQRVLPILESELGSGVAEALARTAEQLREDAEVLDAMATESARKITRVEPGRVQLDAAALLALPAALRQRVIRLVVQQEFGVPLSRQQTLDVARLVTHWRGQGEVHLPRIRIGRADGWLNLGATPGGDPAAKSSGQS